MRSRGALIVTLAVVAVAVLGCVPDPPSSDPSTTTTTTSTTTSTTSTTTTSTTTSTTVPNAGPMVTITSPSGDISVNEVDVIELAATASDPEDGDLGDSVSWKLLADKPGALPVDLGAGATASAGPLSPGSYTVTASVSDSEGLTASDQFQATVTDCKITAVITPGSGNKNAGPLHISAAQSSDSCGRPLEIHWYCASYLSPAKCFDFESEAASLDLTDYTYDLAVDEIIEIGLELCIPTPPGERPECGNQLNTYVGIDPFIT